jgi:hypothetical protein
MARILKVALLLVALLYACMVTWVTTVSAIIARGSDVITFIYGVSLANRVITLVCVACLWIASVYLARMTVWRRWGLRWTGLLALALATHLVVFNERAGSVEEWWLLVPVEHARGNVAEGLSLDWVRSDWLFGVILTHRRSGERSVVFTGIWPWCVNIAPSLELHRL